MRHTPEIHDLTQEAFYRPISENPLSVSELLETIKARDAALLAALQRHPFPGNVRELEFMVEDAICRTRGPRLTVKQFQIAIIHHRPSQPSGADAVYGRQVIEVLSAKLTERFGRGFSAPTLWNFRQFYSVLNENKQIFASKYLQFLPSEQELKLEIEKERRVIEAALEERKDSERVVF